MLSVGTKQQVCFSLTRAVHQTLEERGSHSSALPMRDTELPQPVCTGDTGGREEEKPSWSRGFLETQGKFIRASRIAIKS